jgi:hypothetical protein
MNTDLHRLSYLSESTESCPQPSWAKRKDPFFGDYCNSHDERQDVNSVVRLNIKFEEDEMPYWTSDWTVDRLSDGRLPWN